MLIIGTVGISTKEKGTLKAIINEGVNVLRLNFAHEDIYEFNRIIKEVKGINNKVHILQDLSGRKIRVSEKINKVISLKSKEKAIFCGYNNYNEIMNKYKLFKIIPLNIKWEHLIKNNILKITMKDNTMEFRVLSIEKAEIITEVIRGGVIREHKGCNIKNINRTNWGLSNKDKKDLDWAIKNSIDIICQSFVESKNDIIEVKDYIKKRSSSYKPKIYGKIESEKGVLNVREIVKQVDGIVLGRGDLVPETSLYNVPIIQDRIIRETKKEGKKIIIATHVLNSMKNSYYPEVCEVESIYYEIKKGVDGFLLAGELSIGKNPIRTAKVLNNIIKKYKNNLRC